jgi:hypothetical protein
MPGMREVNEKGKNLKKTLALAGGACYNLSALRTRTVSRAGFPRTRVVLPDPVEVINKNRRNAKWQSYP